MTPEESFTQKLVAPRALAGIGDIRWLSMPLHQVYGWTASRDPLTPSVLLTSPDQQAQVRLNPHPDTRWWDIWHAATPGRPAWSVSAGSRTPVEILAALTDALTDPQPAPPGRDLHPYDLLSEAGWGSSGQHDGLTSPDGYTDVEVGYSALNVETAVNGDPEGQVWEAYLTRSTPLPLVNAFLQAVADTEPLPRDPSDIPFVVRQHLTTRTRHVTEPEIHLPLERRMTALAARSTTSPGPPAPQQPPPPRRRTR
ncbi:DUF317 domain-containing protein [Streptomyces sp. NPDC087440]|uniref:DUF317 domain-containing protein n=1 Tax=Streptomyces sp. NPDC087440 TaxID=3365790 RepID=UPI0037FC74BB